MSTTLNDIGSGFNRSKINDNFATIETALNDNVLKRVVDTGEDNSMQTDLDMNGYTILNLVGLELDGEDVSATIEDLYSSITTGDATTLTSAKAYTDTEVATVQANVDTNSTDIATNTTDIATNASNITTNTTNIATNATGIANLNTRVTQNESDIATNTGDISTNATDIATNTSDITALDSRVTQNETDIATNTSDISTNTSDIATNTSSIATNTTNISTNASNIATNTSDISSLDTRVTDNESDISTNTTNIATNTSNISTNTSDISALDTRVTQNETDISTNTTNISTNTSDIATLDSDKADKIVPATVGNFAALDSEGNLTDSGVNSVTLTPDASAVSYDSTDSGLTATDVQAAIDEVEDRVDTAETNISTNTSSIATNTSDIATNTSDIATNASAISTNTTNIATNTSDISDLDTRVTTNESDISDLQDIGDFADYGLGILTLPTFPSTDSEDLTVPTGVYQIYWNNMDNPDNVPDGFNQYGIVEYISRVTSGAKYMRYTDVYGNTATKSYIGGSWQDWIYLNVSHYGYGTDSITSSGAADCDDLTATGNYIVNSSGTNTPYSTNWFISVVGAGSSGNYVVQHAFRYGLSEIYIRSCASGTWTDWEQVYLAPDVDDIVEALQYVRFVDTIDDMIALEVVEGTYVKVVENGATYIANASGTTTYPGDETATDSTVFSMQPMDNGAWNVTWFIPSDATGDLNSYFKDAADRCRQADSNHVVYVPPGDYELDHDTQIATRCIWEVDANASFTNATTLDPNSQPDLTVLYGKIIKHQLVGNNQITYEGDPSLAYQTSTGRNAIPAVRSVTSTGGMAGISGVAASSLNTSTTESASDIGVSAKCVADNTTTAHGTWGLYAESLKNGDSDGSAIAIEAAACTEGDSPTVQPYTALSGVDGFCVSYHASCGLIDTVYTGNPVAVLTATGGGTSSTAHYQKGIMFMDETIVNGAYLCEAISLPNNHGTSYYTSDGMRGYSKYLNDGTSNYLIDAVWADDGASLRRYYTAYEGIYPATTNVASSGTSSNAWNNVYTQNSPTVTSDETLKTEYGDVSDELRSAARKIAKGAKLFQWKAEIEEKTDTDETIYVHMSPMAQYVYECLEDEGLDPEQYWFVRSRDEDYWTISPTDLMWLIFNAHEQVLEDFEDRISAIEASLAE